jgi:hypothetical protein
MIVSGVMSASWAASMGPSGSGGGGQDGSGLPSGRQNAKSPPPGPLRAAVHLPAGPAPAGSEVGQQDQEPARSAARCPASSQICASSRPSGTGGETGAKPEPGRSLSNMHLTLAPRYDIPAMRGSTAVRPRMRRQANDMDAAAMSLELHGCGIHAVWSATGEAGVTEVRFRLCRRRWRGASGPCCCSQWAYSALVCWSCMESSYLVTPSGRGRWIARRRAGRGLR